MTEQKNPFAVFEEADREYTPEEQKVVDEINKIKINLTGKLTDGGLFEYMSATNDFRDRLMKKYTPEECQRHALFHVAFGSSPKARTSPKFDFEGEDSIFSEFQKYENRDFEKEESNRIYPESQENI